MRLLSFTAVLAGSSTLCAVMALADATPETDIRAVISDQISAFQADDVARAFTFASPALRTAFGDADRFGSMVKAGYPMVWRPGDLRFLGLREGEDGKIQRVMIRDQSGHIHFLDYKMIETGEGWTINGVDVLTNGGQPA